MQKLPVGIQTFSDIRKNNYIYADKTKYALEVIDDYKYVFLSRPRRFGKSLFLDTLHNIFEGNKELFKDLYIYDKWDWEDKYPVIKISWGGSEYKSLENIYNKTNRILKQNQKRLGIVCEDTTPDGCLEELIQKAYEKYNKGVVVLIDEYDKPILNNISNIDIATQMRDFLRGFYEQLKENDAYLRFAFLTGISKFSKANIFSGLNQIEDISLLKRFGDVCGYTQEELEYYFKDYLVDIDLQRVKTWYNGYNFLDKNVYNPFNILKFIKNDFIFNNYWWESGNPFSLIELLKTKSYFIPSLQHLRTDSSLLNSFDIEKLQLESLLFQAGYLTIDRVVEKRNGALEYYLKVPNLEVQISLNNLFVNYLSEKINFDIQDRVYDTLYEADINKFKDTLISLFASIPYNNYVNNKIAFYEGYWASLIYCYLAGSGLKLIAEDVTNSGRIDLTIIVNDNIYVLEFKVEKLKAKSGELKAIEQIKQKNYHQKYLNPTNYSLPATNYSLYLIGIEFSESERNVVGFEWERVDS
jgi:hypothetical protein